MTGPMILTLTTFLPLAGALVVTALRMAGGARLADGASKPIALIVSLACLVVSLIALQQFDPAQSGFQLVEKVAWYEGVSYHLGVDGMAILLVVLTTALTPLCILWSFKSVEERVSDYMIAFLVLETLMIGVFCALDLMLFYVFFEAMLIPVYFMIGRYGGP